MEALSYQPTCVIACFPKFAAQFHKKCTSKDLSHSNLFGALKILSSHKSQFQFGISPHYSHLLIRPQGQFSFICIKIDNTGCPKNFGMYGTTAKNNL